MGVNFGRGTIQFFLLLRKKLNQKREKEFKSILDLSLAKIQAYASSSKEGQVESLKKGFIAVDKIFDNYLKEISPSYVPVERKENKDPSKPVVNLKELFNSEVVSSPNNQSGEILTIGKLVKKLSELHQSS